MKSIEDQLREILPPVFGLDSPDQILPQQSLVRDLGADSIDFVEIVYLVEQHFGVILKTNEMIVGGIPTDSLFENDRLTVNGAQKIRDHLKDESQRYHSGMNRIELFSLLTVRDLAALIALKQKGAPNA